MGSDATRPAACHPGAKEYHLISPLFIEFLPAFPLPSERGIIRRELAGLRGRCGVCVSVASRSVSASQQKPRKLKLFLAR